MKTNTDITIYNKAQGRAEAYYRHALQGVSVPAVMWENRKGANTAKVGKIEADQATLYIPFIPFRDATFLEPVDWDALVSKTGKWTLKKDDVIVRGIVVDQITGPFTVTDLRKKYPDVLIISFVDTNNYGSLSMQHWKVGAN